MDLLYQAVLIIPALVHFFNQKASKILLVVTGALLLVLGFLGVSPLQLPQYIVIVTSLILLVTPASDVQLISLVALIGTAPLNSDLTLNALVFLLFVSSSARRKHGRIGLYVFAAILLALLTRFVGQTYAMAPLILLLVGAVPFQKLLPDLYSDHKSAVILVSLVAVTQLSTNQSSYTIMAPLILILGTLTTIVGVFQCMISEKFIDLFSSIHQVVFGLLLASASTDQLNALFYYLLLPCVLSLMIINKIYGDLSEQADGMFEFGGLSSVKWMEASSALATYLVLFSLVSMGAEIFMQMGIGGAKLFIAIGCSMIFVAAASLAASFRSYTLVFEGPLRSSAASFGTMKYAITLISGVNVVISLVPALLLSTFSQVTGMEFPKFDIFNNILLLLLVAALLSALTVFRVKLVKKKSWTMGYASVEDPETSRGEIFTSWREIFRPLYNIRIPDEAAAKALDKINPSILFVVLVVLAALGAMI